MRHFHLRRQPHEQQRARPSAHVPAHAAPAAAESAPAVDATLAETKRALGEVQGLLAELAEEIALVKQLPELKAMLEQVHAAVADR